MMSHPRVFEHAFQVSHEDIDRLGHVNALPPLKVVQLLGNACLSPTTLAPRGPVPTPWTPVDPVVFSLLRRAALGDPQRPCGWLGDVGRMVGEGLTTCSLG